MTNAEIAQKMHELAVKFMDEAQASGIGPDNTMKVWCVLLGTQIRTTKAVNPSLNVGGACLTVIHLIRSVVDGKFDNDDRTSQEHNGDEP